MAKFATHNPLAEVYLIQFLFKVDQYTNQEHNHIFFVIQQCCVTHQYFFVSCGKIYIESSFYIHFTRNSIFIMKKIKTVVLSEFGYKILGLWDGNILFLKNVYRCIVRQATYQLPIKGAPHLQKNFRYFLFLSYDSSYLLQIVQRR